MFEKYLTFLKSGITRKGKKYDKGTHRFTDVSAYNAFLPYAVEVPTIEPEPIVEEEINPDLDGSGRLNKVEVIDYLKSENQEVDEEASYRTLMKQYKKYIASKGD